jgi:hypothetical protein
MQNLPAVKFYLEKDSIIHPGLSFVYQVDKKDRYSFENG